MFDTKYLTYTEYKDTLEGTLTENAFNLLEYEARKKIDQMTFGRLKELTTQINEVKLCIFKLIGILNENNTSIKSESVDGYSYTIMDKKDLENLKESIVEEYLSECYLEDEYNTPYLYVGDETTDRYTEVSW
jgi:hypothetical protein